MLSDFSKASVVVHVRSKLTHFVGDALDPQALVGAGVEETGVAQLDLLARAGTRFANNSVCTPICSASRATQRTCTRLPGCHMAVRPRAAPPRSCRPSRPSSG